MSPHFVIISLCGNDFGNYSPEGLDESCYWLEQIFQLCRTRRIPYLVVPWPGEDSLLVLRNEGVYPGLLTRRIRFGGKSTSIHSRPSPMKTCGSGWNEIEKASQCIIAPCTIALSRATTTSLRSVVPYGGEWLPNGYA